MPQQTILIWTIYFSGSSQADDHFHGMLFLSNWCQELEMELCNAGQQDASFHELRIAYCQEFCQCFPESAELILHNMKRAAAESHFALGDANTGDAAFASLIEEYPHNTWGYIGWGDMYGPYRLHPSIPADYERARRIYQWGLDRGTDEQEEVHARLRELNKAPEPVETC